MDTDGGLSIGRELETLTTRTGSPPGGTGDMDVVRQRITNLYGRRYLDCSLSNWVYHGSAAEQARQKRVHAAIDAYVKSIEESIDSGKNLILAGPPGTGKDRFLVSSAKAAIVAGKTVTRFTGAELWGRTRDLIDTNGTESELIRKLREPAVLIISDPLPPGTSLTDHQATWLYRIVDRRYTDQKPVWITINVADSAEASQRLRPQVWDRLRDGALVVECQWPTYRTPCEVVR